MEETPQVSEDKRSKNKRKRGKSVLKNARRYGKQGKFGRGAHLDEDVYQYFVRVLELLKAGFDNDEEKQCLVNNAFEEIKGNEVYYSYNQIGCRVIESLLPFAEAETLERIISCISEDLRKISYDRFASYVLQKLVAICADRAIAKMPEGDKIKIISDDHKEKCNLFTIKISKYLLNNLEDFVWDNFANRIIRQCIMSLSGMEPKENKDKNKYAKDTYNYREVPADWSEIVEDYVQRLLKWPQLHDFPYSELTSGLLQIIIMAITKQQPKLQKQLIKHLAQESFMKNREQADMDKTYPVVFDSEPATRLLEVVLNACSEKVYSYIFKKCFMGHLRPLSLMRSSNFAIQYLLNNCSDKDILESILNEIEDSFGDILASGHTGILVSMTKACRRLSTQQAKLIKIFSNMLECSDDNSSYKFAPLVIQLLPLGRAEKSETFVINMHGSIVIQDMLWFNKPIKVVNSLMAMSPNDLLRLFCDPKGSHIADAFFQSQFIGEKSREKMCRILKGTFTDLATSKHGSRALEHILEKSNIVQQNKIMAELVQRIGILMGSDIGKIIGNKYNVELYKRNPTDWEQYFLKQSNIKNMFSDIIAK